MDISTATDIKILLDFVGEPTADQNDHSSQITCLQALTTMCESKIDSEKLLNLGGMEIIKKLLYSSSNFTVKESCIYLIACATNSSNTVKETFCNKDFFEHIKMNLFAAHRTATPFKTKEAYLYLLLSMISKNENAQNILLTFGLLNELGLLFLQGAKILIEGWSTKYDSGEIIKLWEICTKVLTAIMKEHANANDQNHCKIFRSAITILHESIKERNHIIIQICKLLAASVHKNEACKKMVLQSKGLEVAILKLQGALSDCDVNTKLVTTILDLLLSLIPETLNEYNRFANLGGLHLTLKAINSNRLDATSADDLLLLNAGILLIAKSANTSELVRKILVSCNAANQILSVMNRHNIQGRLNRICTQLLLLCAKHQNTPNMNSEKETASDWDGSSTDSNSLEERENLDTTPKLPDQSVLNVFQKLSEQINLLQKVVLQEKTLRKQADKKLDEILESRSNAPSIHAFQKHTAFPANHEISSFENSKHSNFNHPNILTSTLLLPNKQNDVFALPDKGLDDSNLECEEGSSKRDLSTFHIGNTSKNDLSDDVAMINTSSKTMFTPKTSCQIIEAIGKEKEKLGGGDNPEKQIGMSRTNANKTKKYNRSMSPAKNYCSTTSPAYSTNKIIFDDHENTNTMKSFLKQRPNILAKGIKSLGVKSKFTRNLPNSQQLTGVPKTQKMRIINSCIPSRSGLLMTHNVRYNRMTGMHHKSTKLPLVINKSRMRHYSNDMAKNRNKLSRSDIDNIQRGIALKMNWREILMSYNFHPNMTAADLRHKYYIHKESTKHMK